jgi:hypothetical protein
VRKTDVLILALIFLFVGFSAALMLALKACVLRH